MKKDLEKAKSYIYRLLTIRPRSEREIRSKLKEKAYASAVAKDAVSFFREQGLIDDLKFARSWVESRMRLSPKGDIVLSYELKNKGVAEDIIKEVLKDKRLNFNEREQVRVIISDLKEKNKNLHFLKLKKKIYDHLARRGFDYDVIKDSMDEVFGAE